MNKIDIVNPPSNIKTKITLLSTGVVFISLIMVALLLGQFSFVKVETLLDSHVMDIARTVSLIPDITKNVGRENGEEIIQPITESIRKKTGTEYIIVFDFQRKKYSDPSFEEIGKEISGWDWMDVLLGREYILKASTPAGPILKAYVPVLNENKQAGAVLVGMMLKNVNDLSVEIRFSITAVTIIGLFIGLIGSSILADNIKNTMFNLEPYEIAAFFMEFEAVLESVRDAIIAVDENCRITMANGEARRMLNVEKITRGEDITLLMPNSKLPEIISSGEPEFDQEQTIGNFRVIGNKIPIVIKGKITGAIASYRDITEMLSLAEELTGVKEYVEALRIQNHEFSNKLHTLSGLIQLSEYSKALEYISSQTDIHTNIISFVSRKIHSAAVAGLLLGKRGKCLELGVDFTIDKDSSLGKISPSNSSSLVVIIGNLIENAIAAVSGNDKDKRKIIFSIFHELDKVYITVADNGIGISPEIAKNIYAKGFTTKKNYNSGYGLYLIKSIVDSYDGEINFEKNGDGMTEFFIILKIKEV
ncbi:MAG: sensor histidine kinase [Spirochaetia bacterium]|nr:sensor histidine kinase [Spirochaetia bacterium]